MTKELDKCSRACRTQVSIQLNLIEACRKRSRKLLLQTLLMDPVVNSVSSAEKMLDYMLDLQKEYLGEYDDDMCVS